MYCVDKKNGVWIEWHQTELCETTETFTYSLKKIKDSVGVYTGWVTVGLTKKII